MGGAGLTLAQLAHLQAARANRSKSCIFLFLLGGPSQIDTWDPKPAAPAEVRGPFNPIATNVSGIQICEHFPRMARLADLYALVRSVHHEAAPIHETGQQLMQTGRLHRPGEQFPHVGAVLSACGGSRNGQPAFAIVPAPLGNTGVAASHGQSAGFLGSAHEPVHVTPEPAPSPCIAATNSVLDSGRMLSALDHAHRTLDDAGWSEFPAWAQVLSPSAKNATTLSKETNTIRTRYGYTLFGQSCLLARRLVEAGVRLVTVNMFDTVFDKITWDCHADGNALPTRLEDYKRVLCPIFDQAYSALLEDLNERGMLDDTLVVATGEFGRTPRLNPRGGRDHWPGVWTMLFAGGGVKGGQVVGASDKIASEPADRPVSPAEVTATIYAALGVDPSLGLRQPTGDLLPLATAAPIRELF
jgi:uncharacterized protein (DUF1501 family)